MTVTPAFAVLQLSSATVTLSGNATDANGDALTYTWSIGTQQAVGNNATVTVTAEHAGTALLTVTDGRGGTATDTRPLVAASMTGAWQGDVTGLGAVSYTLTQAAGAVTGTYTDKDGPGAIASGSTVDAGGNVQLIIDQPRFELFRFAGRINTNTGKQVTGTVHDGGFTGQAFTINKQSASSQFSQVPSTASSSQPRTGIKKTRKG
jgi:hypothetical protein